MVQNNIFKIIVNLPTVKIEFFQAQYGFFSTNFYLKELMLILKNHFIFYFKILTYISGLDYPENLNRFKLVYDLLSLKYNSRIRVKILVDSTIPTNSISLIFNGANWWESEAWDMFGIVFSRQKTIIRLLTDYGFYGYPLRKDFPLSGFLESKYNLFKNKISYNKIELAQSYRLFRQSSPWEKNKKSMKNLKIIFLSKTHYKTDHSFHLVDPSPWPILGSLGGFCLTLGGVLFMHKYSGGWSLFLTGLFIIFYTMYVWWRDIIREATFEDCHTIVVQKGLRLGMVLFIISEVMFFFAFFWAFFHSSIAPVYNIGGVWPPKAISVISTYAIPLTNTFFLLSSGATVSWAHHAILSRHKQQTIFGLLMTLILALWFTKLQIFEYINAPFSISDSIYGSCFYLATGFHGFHVVIGTIALFISLIRVILNHFTNTHHFGLEAAIWYWHFVDVVWLFLFINVYWWSNK